MELLTYIISATASILAFALVFTLGLLIGLMIMLLHNLKTRYPEADGLDHRGEENLSIGRDYAMDYDTMERLEAIRKEKENNPHTTRKESPSAL